MTLQQFIFINESVTGKKVKIDSIKFQKLRIAYKLMQGDNEGAEIIAMIDDRLWKYYKELSNSIL